MAAHDGIVLMGFGDVGPVHGDMKSYAELAKSTLAAADIRIGQCERVYSTRGALQVQMCFFRHFFCSENRHQLQPVTVHIPVAGHEYG